MNLVLPPGTRPAPAPPQRIATSPAEQMLVSPMHTWALRAVLNARLEPVAAAQERCGYLPGLPAYDVMLTRA